MMGNNNASNWSSISDRHISVALWDIFALKLNTYISEHHNDTAPVFIILRLAKLKAWGSKDILDIILYPQVGNLTTLDVNVESSTHTTQLNPYTVMTNPGDYYLRFPIKNIDDIPDYNKFRFKQCMNQKISLIIIATIIGFNADEGRYSFYCRDCSKKVANKVVKCDGCEGVSNYYVTIVRIRVLVHVQDESGTSSFVLFERRVKDLIHCSTWFLVRILLLIL
uniref:Replication factor A C-terminal domain-containing protein n=1 Tax=Lactuca sativa TaxID=4236 RepID=A0A9R1WFR5_LACSA|nr:hypothetical protein LSAT_V11C200089360 [Lactuca sativa]